MESCSLLVMMFQPSSPDNYCVLKKGQDQDLPLNWQKPWKSGLIC